MIKTYFLSLNKFNQFVIEKTVSEKGEKGGLLIRHLGWFKAKYTLERIPKFLVNENVIIKSDKGETEEQARLIFCGTNGDPFIYNILPRLRSYIDILVGENNKLKLEVNFLKKRLYSWKNEDLRRKEEIENAKHQHDVRTAGYPAETFGYGSLYRPPYSYRPSLPA